MSQPDPIQDLQERIAYLEQNIEEINDVVVGLNRKVSVIEARLRKVNSAVQRVEAQTEQTERDPKADVPPHYGLPRSVSPEQLRQSGRRDAQ